MFGIGLPELMVILALALIVLGPEKLPQVAKQIARFVGELKKASEDFKKELNVEELEKLKKPIKLDSLLEEELEKELKTPGPIAKGSDHSTTMGGLGQDWKEAGGPRRAGSEEMDAQTDTGAETSEGATGADAGAEGDSVPSGNGPGTGAEGERERSSSSAT